MKDVSRRHFLLQRAGSSLRETVRAAAGHAPVGEGAGPASPSPGAASGLSSFDEVRHPRQSGPMISGVAGGLAWDVLAANPPGAGRFSRDQKGWDGQQALLGGYVVPFDAEAGDRGAGRGKRLILSPTPAHCVACLNNPVRWRVLVEGAEELVFTARTAQVSGVLSLVHHPDAPFYYRLHVARAVDFGPLLNEDQA